MSICVWRTFRWAWAAAGSPVGQYYLMAVLRDGGKRKAALADRARGDWALEQLRTLAPELRTGWVPGRD